MNDLFIFPNSTIQDCISLQESNSNVHLFRYMKIILIAIKCTQQSCNYAYFHHNICLFKISHVKKILEMSLVHFPCTCDFRTFNRLKTTEQAFTEIINSFNKIIQHWGWGEKKHVIQKPRFEGNERELGREAFVFKA